MKLPKARNILLGVLVAVLVIAGGLVIAQDQETLRVRVPVGASDPRFPEYTRYSEQVLPELQKCGIDPIPHSYRTAHWAMGAFVRKLGPASAQVESYYAMYWLLAGLLALSLLGLPCLRALRNREVAEGALPDTMVPEKP